MKSGKNNKDNVVEQMKKQIKTQIEDQPDEVQELIFSKITIPSFTPEINGLLAKYPKLVALEFNNCSITSLEGLTPSKNLIKLSFEENGLDGQAVNYIVANFPELQFLSLSSNKIKTLKDLESLEKLKKLVQLDLQENEVAKLPEYKETLFKICDKLDILDNKDKDGKEVEYSDEDDVDIDDAEIEDDEDESYTEDEEEDYDEEEEEDEEDKPQKKRKR